MTATDELRAELTRRGVEYEKCDTTKGCFTLWRANGIDAGFDDMERWEQPHLLVVGFTPAQAVEATLGPTVTGETSDGYHTFNELYHHRAVLFSVIVRDHRALAWKSRLHHDGTMYDGMFIVGIDTPSGQATYHYDVEPYWGMFDCKELERAPEWDGHTPDEAIARIATLGAGTCEMEPVAYYRVSACSTSWGCVCSSCGGFHEFTHGEGWHYCPNCGRRIEGVDE